MIGNEDAQWLVYGLGNPEVERVNNRHNVGELVAALLPKLEDVVVHAAESVMNSSGVLVKEMLERHSLLASALILVYDDLDLPVGRIKVSRGGRSGGHRGVQSCIDELGTDDFIRVRVGIGRPPAGTPVLDYVLGDFTKAELDAINAAVKKACEAIQTITIGEGLAVAMMAVNKKTV